VAKNAQGGWSGELISVDQGNVTFPIEAIKYQNAVMSFEVKIVSGSFEGTVKATALRSAGNGNRVAAACRWYSSERESPPHRGRRVRWVPPRTE
jgi:hypothetical protein